MKKILQENALLFFILIFLSIESVLFSIGNNKLNKEYLSEKNRVRILSEEISNLSLQAKAVSVYDDTDSEKIYRKNDTKKLPIASLTKIMTAIVTLNTKEKETTITPLALKQETDYGFLIGEKFKTEDLIKFTLIGSVNDSAYAFSEGIPDFLQKMNEKAKKIGMENAEFFNPTGLDINSTLSGGYASAKDINTMALYGFKYYPEIFGATIKKEMEIKSKNDFVHKIKNTNEMLEKIPNVLFSKTGYTPLAGGNLSVIFKDQGGHTIAVAVLGSSMDGRFSDMEKIIEVLYNFNYGK